MVRAFAKNKDNNLFVGFTNISGNISYISNALFNTKYKVDAIALKNKYEYEKSTIVKPNNSTIKFLNRLYSSRIIYLLYTQVIFFIKLWKNDIFLFIWKKSFLPYNIDFFLIKWSGRKIIVLHCGSEVKVASLANQLHRMDYYNENKKINTLNIIRTMYYQYISEKNAVVISHPSQATFQIGELFYINLPISDNTNLKNEKEKISIVHAPTNRNIKGTGIVEKAITKLREEGFEFKFNLIENLSHKELLETLKKTDILIDQPGDVYGTLTIEGLASSCCVISGKVEVNKKYQSPILTFEPNVDHLLKQIKSVLKSKQELNKNRLACYNFWQANYNPIFFESFIDELLNLKTSSFFPRQDQKKILLDQLSGLNYYLVYIFYKLSKQTYVERQKRSNEIQSEKQ